MTDGRKGYQRCGIPVLATFMMLGTIGGRLDAESTQIIVDVEKGTLKPEAPVVNIAAEQPIRIDIQPKKRKWRMTLTMATLEAAERLPAETPSTTETSKAPVRTRNTTPPLRVRPELVKASGDAFIINFARTKCGVGRVEVYGMVWNVCLGSNSEQMIGLTIEEDTENPTLAITVPILLEYRSFALSWSAGFLFLKNQDQRFRLDEMPGDPAHRSLVNLGTDGIRYQLAAFANYKWLNLSPATMSFGIATDVPVDRLTAVLGASWPIETVPIADSMVLTAGVAYSSQKRLRAEYRGTPVVPAGLGLDALTETKYGLGWFAAITFSFFGRDAEARFKTVYPGTTNGH